MNIIGNILRSILLILMSTLTLSVIWQVISRYILIQPAAWSDEVARFSMSWIAMLGGVYVYTLDKHLAVSILPELLQGKDSGRFLRLIFNLLVIFLGVIMCLGGYKMVLTNFQNGQLSSVLKINMGYVYSAVPLSGGLLIICALISSYKEGRTLLNKKGAV